MVITGKSSKKKSNTKIATVRYDEDMMMRRNKKQLKDQNFWRLKQRRRLELTTGAHCG